MTQYFINYLTGLPKPGRRVRFPYPAQKENKYKVLITTSLRYPILFFLVYLLISKFIVIFGVLPLNA